MKQKRVRVIAFGTFDILHPGHVYYLKSAKKLGNELIVIVARDSTVARIKGKQPVNDERIRREMVSALRYIHKAVLGNAGNIYDKVKELRPNVIALGYDQHMDTAKLQRELRKRNVECKVMRLKAFNQKKFKSSILKHKIRTLKK